MDVSGVSASNVQQAQGANNPVAIEVQKQSEKLDQQVTAQLIDSVPDSDSSLGQNVDVTV